MPVVRPPVHKPIQLANQAYEFCLWNKDKPCKIHFQSYLSSAYRFIMIEDFRATKVLCTEKMPNSNLGSLTDEFQSSRWQCLNKVPREMQSHSFVQRSFIFGFKFCLCDHRDQLKEKLLFEHSGKSLDHISP